MPAFDPIVEHVTAHDADELVEVAAWGETPIVTVHAEPQAEYAALRKACGLIARGDMGVVEATGTDAVTFLNNLLTNALVSRETKQAMPVGTGCASFFLNIKGRVVADPLVLRVAEDRVLLVLSRRLAGVLAGALDVYRFAEKVRLRDASDAWYVLAVAGPDADAVLSDAADAAVTLPGRPDDFPATSFLPVAPLRLGGTSGYVAADDLPGVAVRLLLVPRDRALAVWQDLLTRFGETLDARRFGQRRLRAVGWAMFNATRIEAGRPLLEVDFAPATPSRPGQKADADEAAPASAGVLPAETGPLFGRCVSVTGGCYLGQEVVARMHARKAVARSLVGLRMDEDALPAAGAPVEVAGVQVGVVTGSTLSPVLSSAAIALATLKRPHFEVGTSVTVPAEGRHARATVVPLPFVGS